MVQNKVRVERQLAVPAVDVWAVARQFCGHWHPFMDWIEPEQNGFVRRFAVTGETGHYRERLTYFSESDMEIRYEMLEGIAGASFYRATFRITKAEGNSCTVAWSADIDATDDRAEEIALGTSFVFEAGLEVLAQTPKTIAVEFRLEIPPQRLHVEIVPGSPQLALTSNSHRTGPLVLFLHGIGGNRKNWDLQHALPLQTAAMDLRGYGDSQRGHTQSRVDDYCDDILQVMNHFDRREVILCGLSHGSWIATSFAMRHPDKLQGLILSGGCTGMSEASACEREAFFVSRQKPLDDGKTPADFADAVVNVIAGPNASASTRGVLHASMSCISTQTYRDAIYCFTHPEETFDFSRITCPVLLMTGEYDRLASPPEIRGVANRIHQASQHADVRFEVIADAGHVCNLEQPDRYNTILSEFLQRFPS